jgi:hypothetical protein
MAAGGAAAGDAARQFIAQLLPYKMRPSLMTRAIGWSLIVQIGGSVAVALVARALGVALPMAVWFAVVPLVTLAMTLPISMLGFGIREQGLEFLLAPHGVLPEQAVAIGRALMTNPRVLLLDEVSLGLSPVAVDGVYASLDAVAREGTPMIVVEQDLGRVFAVADRIACMLEGRVVASGRAADMTRDEVMRHYFGRRSAATTGDGR